MGQVPAMPPNSPPDGLSSLGDLLSASRGTPPAACPQLLEAAPMPSAPASHGEAWNSALL